jgi:hypothetical protein
VITLRRHKVAGVDYYQVVYTRRSGETIQSHLMKDRKEAVKWAVWLIQTKAHSPSSPKAGS